MQRTYGKNPAHILIKMLEQNSLLMLWWLMIMMLGSIKALPVAEPVEQEQENSAAFSDFGRVLYDQRQDGKYNIHVSIKDVAIIDMDNNKIEDDVYDDGEYYYDDGDITVKPLILNPTTNKPIVTNTTTPIMYRTSQILHAGSENNSFAAVITTILNAEENPTSIITTTINEETETTQKSIKKKKKKTTIMPAKSNNSEKHLLQLNAKELQREIGRQTPESPIYRFEVSQQQKNTLQQTLAQFKEKQLEQQYQQQQQQQKQDQAFVKAFEKPMFFQTKPILKQQQLQQHVRYPMPMQQHHQHQRQSLHTHCHANQYRDFSGNCQTRRGVSSTSATAILRKFFNMFLTLPLRDREQERE